MRLWSARALVIAALGLVGCATTGPVAPPAWQAPLGREHALAGRVWDVAARRFLAPDVLQARLRAARFVLLGEKHDNPDHHRLQARVVRALVDAGRRPAVAFEMLHDDDAPALARHLAAAPRDAAGLGDAVGWASSGWPDWAHYRPIAEAALDAGLPILTANIAPSTARALSRGGRPPLPDGLVERHGLDRPLPADTQRAMSAEIRAAHCGHGSEQMATHMVFAQRVRDARMADSLLAGERDGAVLIAGAGHARTDRGVPAYLRAQRPGATIVSLAFVEVADGHTEPARYAERFNATTLPFDYVWFTPRVDDVDHCETFRKALERRRP